MCIIIIIVEAFEDRRVTCTQGFYLDMVVLTLGTYGSGDKWKEEWAMQIDRWEEWRQFNIQRHPNDEALEPFAPHKKVLDAKCYCQGKVFVA